MIKANNQCQRFIFPPGALKFIANNPLRGPLFSRVLCFLPRFRFRFHFNPFPFVLFCLFFIKKYFLPGERGIKSAPRRLRVSIILGKACCRRRVPTEKGVKISDKEIIIIFRLLESLFVVEKRIKRSRGETLLFNIIKSCSIENVSDGFSFLRLNAPVKTRH